MSTSLIKINLDRVPDVEAREVDGCLATRTSNVGWNRGVGVDDELAPDGHEGALKLRSLGGCCRAEVARDVGTVLSGRDGVLVFERGFVASVSFGHPVRGADESCLGINVIGALLLACSKGGLVEGGWTRVTESCKVDCRRRV